MNQGELMLKPHGGSLINRVLNPQRAAKAAADAADMPHLKVGPDTISDLNNIARGVFSPLTGFNTHDDLDSIVRHDSLSTGLPWTIPILLSIHDGFSSQVKEGDDIALVSGDTNEPVAIMNIGDRFHYDRSQIAEAVFGTTDDKHPGVRKIYSLENTLIGGNIDLIKQKDSPYEQYNLSPSETRYLFKQKGWKTVVGFQTRNPPHRAHEYLQKCALEICDGLFINPVIGKKKVGDFTDDLILAAYEKQLEMFYPNDRAVMSILPFEMRYAGPKEAIFHAIARKNFGCTHFIVGRDHAGVGDYYDTYAAHRIFEDFDFLGIEPLFFDHSFYCKTCGGMGTTKTCPHDRTVRLNPSGTLIRAVVTEKADIDSRIMRSEIAEVLKSEDNPFVTE